ncbi:MAG: ComEA family DNA-binding protein [Nocardioides sp.]
MRMSRSRPEHQQAVSRRLAQLGAELAAVRGADPPAEPPPTTPAPDTHTRIRPGRLADWLAAEGWEGPVDQPVDQPVAQPVGAPRPGPVPTPREPGPALVLTRPGRHAARRAPSPVRLLAGRLPGGLAWGPGPVAAMAVLVSIGLAVTAWSAVRSRPEPIPMGVTDGAVPLVTPVAAPAITPSGSGDPVADVVVDVAGKVRHPGLAVLTPGARVADALAAAGGARPGVDLSSLNLARPLVDGEQILVGVPGRPGLAPVAPAGSVAPALVNINTATAIELEALPEVGPVTAQAILTWRVEHGGFTSVDDLLDVDGIGEVTLARLAPLVTL